MHFAVYAYENGFAGEEQRIETEAGIVIGRRINESEYEIRLNTPCNIRLDEQIECEGEILKLLIHRAWKPRNSAPSCRNKRSKKALMKASYIA